MTLSIICVIYLCSQSPVNDQSSDGSSDGSGSSEGSSSEGEEEVQQPLPESEVKAEPENSVKWNLSEFLPGKSPNEAPLSHEPVETVKMDDQDDEEDGETHRTPSDHYQNENSNSSNPEKSDASHEADELSMPPPSKVKSIANTPDKTPDTDLNSVFVFIKSLQPIQPISSISDSDDNVDVTSGTERPKKKRPKKQRLRPEVDGNISSSDESSSRFSDSRRRSSMDEKKPGRGRPKNNSMTLLPQIPSLTNPYDAATNTSSDTNSINGTKKTHKSPRKEPQSRKSSTKRRRSISLKKSRETIPSSEGSSDENATQKQKPSKPSPAKKKEAVNHQPPAKKPLKKKKPKSPEKIASPIASSSESESERRTKHSPYHSPVRANCSSSEHSDSDGSMRSSPGVKGKKIEKNKIDNKKNNIMRILFNASKKNEGGKGGKGGAKGKGQVVVITPEDAQSQSKSNDSIASSNGALSVQNPKYLSPSSAFITATPSVIVRIDLSRIDLSRLQIPPEKLKNTVIRTKSPAVPIETPRKSKKRRRSSNHDEQDRWRHHPNSSKNFDQLSVSSSSSSSSSSGTSDHQQIENPANRLTSYTTNYTNDQLNNNIDHKTKEMNSFYHSPSSVDTKLPKIKRESGNYSKQFQVTQISSPGSAMKFPSNDFKNKIKMEVKQEDFDVSQDMRKRSSSMNTNNSHTYKDKKRKRPGDTNDNSLPMPPTNHERLSSSGLANGDLSSKPEAIKKVYVSYFEGTSDEIEQAEAR